MEVYLIRHGQMEAAGGVERYDLNIINQYMTRRKEHGLTEKGQWEIGRAAEFLRPLNITALYSSDFIRARESAAILGKALGLENKIIKGIGEVNAGMMDPKKSPLLQAILIGSRKLYQRHPDFVTKRIVPVVWPTVMYNYLFRWMLGLNNDGEVYEETMARFDRSFREIIESNPPDSRVAVVSHGYVITLNCIRAVRNHPGDIVRVGNPLVANGSVTKFIINKDLDLRLVYFAHKEHLR